MSAGAGCGEAAITTPAPHSDHQCTAGAPGISNLSAGLKVRGRPMGTKFLAESSSEPCMPRIRNVQRAPLLLVAYFARAWRWSFDKYLRDPQPQLQFESLNHARTSAFLIMNWLLITIAFVAAQGGFIYGFDSGARRGYSQPGLRFHPLTQSHRHHRHHLWP